MFPNKSFIYRQRCHLLTRIRKRQKRFQQQMYTRKRTLFKTLQFTSIQILNKVFFTLYFYRVLLCTTLMIFRHSGKLQKLDYYSLGLLLIYPMRGHCFWTSNVCFPFQKMTWPNSTVEDSPRTLMLCTRKQSNGAFRFFLWQEPDDLVALKWCPALTPLLLLSYLNQNN